jgi:hypothetical protein
MQRETELPHAALGQPAVPAGVHPCSEMEVVCDAQARVGGRVLRDEADCRQLSWALRRPCAENLRPKSVTGQYRAVVGDVGIEATTVADQREHLVRLLQHRAVV